MVDRVELILFDKLQEVWELQGDDPLRLDQNRQAAYEVVESRDVRQDVVAYHQVGGHALPDEVAGERLAEKRHLRWNAACAGGGGHVGRGLDAETTDPVFDEVLQQVPVVARNLNNLARPVQLQAWHYRGDVVSRVRQPRVRVRREVRVFGKDLLRLGEFSKLDQKAFIADVNSLRIEPLHIRQLLGGQVGVGERRHAKVDEQSVE